MANPRIIEATKRNLAFLKSKVEGYSTGQSDLTSADIKNIFQALEVATNFEETLRPACGLALLAFPFIEQKSVWSRAIPSYKKLATTLHQSSAKCDMLNRLGVLETEAMRFEDAEFSLGQSLQVAEALDSSYYLAEATYYLAVLKYKSQSTDESLALAQKALDLYSEFDHKDGRRGCGYSRNLIGQIYLDFGKTLSAESLLEQAVDDLKFVNQFLQVSRSLHTLGKAKAALGKLDDALRAFEESERFLDQNVEVLAHHNLLITWSGQLHRVDRFDEAMEVIRRGNLSLLRKFGYFNELVRFSINASAVHISLGNFVEAENFSREGIEMAEKIGNKLLLGVCWNNLGEVYHETKRFKESNQAIKQTRLNLDDFIHFDWVQSLIKAGFLMEQKNSDLQE